VPAFPCRKIVLDRVFWVKPPTGLTAAARAAYSRAEHELGEGATRYRTALLSYVYAVDLESRARDEWERDKRPLVSVFADGRPKDVHPLLRVVMETARSAAYHGGQLGLSPASAKRVGGQRGRGRPVGAVSAPDRVALPPIQLASRRPGAVIRKELPEPLEITTRVNPARGHDADSVS